MAQIDDLQAYTNFELPRRTALLTVAITGYDGNPNDGGAPVILQASPTGTWYLRETPSRVYYRKANSGATDWESADPMTGGSQTLESMTIPVDYNDGSAVDPAADTIFRTQQDVDDFLAANSATNFKHLTAVWYALPVLIAHDVTINMAAGVHRPRNPEPVDTGRAFPLYDRQAAGGVIFIVGPNSGWDLVDPSLDTLSITAVGNAPDPYLDFAGTPFNGFDLRGLHVELSTGQFNTIHDHTDARLYLVSGHSPDPTGGTCSVVRPSAILRNSYDDATKAFPFALVETKTVAATSPQSLNPTTSGFVVFRYLRFDSFGPFRTISALSASSIAVQWCAEDYILQNTAFGIAYGTGNFAQAGSTGCAMTVRYCGVRTNTTGNGFALFGIASNNARTTVRECVGYGRFLYGLWAGAGGKSEMLGGNNVFDHAGRSNAQGIRLTDGATTYVQDFATAHPTEVRNANNGVYVATGTWQDQPLQGVIITNASGPAVVVTGPLASINFQTNTPIGFKDGGGNADVGIEFQGLGGIVTLNTATDVTGANGDVRMADGGILSYATIAASGPFIDTGNNLIKKV